MPTSAPGTALSGRFLALALVALTGGSLGGCVARKTHYLDYVEPTSEPVAARQLVIDAPPERAQAQLVAGLGEGPLTLETVDSDGRFVVARYTGDADPWVDCGTIFEVPIRSTPSVGRPRKATNFFSVIENGKTFSRRMQLDGRLVATIEGEGAGTVIRPTTSYVVSRIVEEDGSGRRGSETIAFASGERAAFQRGTACQPTGRLEEAVFAAVERGATEVAAAAPVEAAPEATGDDLPADPPPQELAFVPPRVVIEPVGIEPLAAPPPPPSVVDPVLARRLALAVPEGSCGAVIAERAGRDSVAIQGIVSDLFTMDSMLNIVETTYPNAIVDNQLTVLSEGACRAYRLVEEGRGFSPDARLQPVDLENGVLTEGDVIRLALDLPDQRSDIHVSHFRRDGSVDHYELEAPSPIEPDVPLLIDMRIVVGPPYGQEFILAFATEGPLFDEPRPASESAFDFVPALEDSLDESATKRPVSSCSVVATAPTAADGPSSLSQLCLPPDATPSS